MTRRSNRSRGTQAVNMGTGLKARSMQSMAPMRSRRKAGSETLEDAVRYVFGGIAGPNADEYATIPDWTPLGLPFEVRAKAVPLTVDAVDRRVYSSTADRHRLRLISGATWATDFKNTSGSNSALAGNAAPAVGVPYAQIAIFTALQSEVIGGDSSASIAQSVTLAPLTGIANNGAGSSGFFHGPIWDVELIDNSPIQNTDACVGDATRYVQLDEPIVLESDFEIEFDCVLYALAGVGAFSRAIGGNGGGSSIGWTSDATASAIPGQVFVKTEGSGFDYKDINVAQGQHVRLRVVRAAGTATIFVDEVDVGSSAAPGDFIVEELLAGGTAEKPASGSALQNVKIKDITNDREWLYTLDEGAGTDARNTGKTQGNYLGLPMYNTDVLEGNANRHIDIPAFVAADGEEVILRADLIYQETAAGNSFWAVATDKDVNDNRFQINDSGNPNPRRVQISRGGNSALFNNALASVAAGQHITLEVRMLNVGTELLLNGTSLGTVAALSGIFNVDVLGYITGASMPANASLQNATLENLTTGEYVQYRIDEGEGTTIKAYDQGGNVIGLLDEEIVNRDFSSPAGWNTTVGDWEVSGGSANCDGSGDIFRSYNLGYWEGKTVEVTYTIINYVSGDVQCAFWNAGNNTGTLRSANGTYTERITVTTGASQFGFRTAGFVGSIDICSVREVAAGEVTPDASWATIPPYTNDGQWTPDADWQNFPNNNRHYPMNRTYIDNETGEIIDIIGGQNGQIQNFNPDNLVKFP